MQYMKPRQCQDCIKPVSRRLGLFQAHDEYECYAESYVKCFWGMCDHHKSLHAFAKEPDSRIITKQPLSENIMILRNPDLMVKDIILSK